MALEGSDRTKEARDVRELALICDAHDGTCEAQTLDYYAARIWEHTDTFETSIDRRGGDIVAATFVDAPMGSDRAFVRLFVHPEFRRPGFNLKVAEFLARQLVAERAPAPTWLRIDRALLSETTSLPPDVLAAYERHGFEFFYMEHEMQRGTEAIPAASPPCKLVMWEADYDPEIRTVYNDAFRSRGFAGYDEHDWVGATFSAEDTFRQDLSFLAIDGDQIAGFCLCAIDEADSMRALIDTLGVRPAYRARGIATALMTRAMTAMREAGFKRVALRVNEDNEPARRLYEKLGFETVKKHVVYRKQM